MPILDVRVIGPLDASVRRNLSARLADAAAAALGTGPFNTWVTVQMVPRSDHAENGGGPPRGVRPVIVRLLKREVPRGRALESEVRAVTKAIAAACRRPAENVHVIYEPEGRGRVAFGGTLVK